MNLVREHIFEEEEWKPKWLKGPTQDEIKNRIRSKIKDWSLDSQFIYGLNNNLKWLIYECLEQGIDPTYNNGVFLE